MLLKTGFTFDKVLFSQVNKNHLVVSLEAPPLSKSERRLPICIVPVIDISGSMQGSKLDYAKKSVLKLIDHLQPGDFCGIVTFGSDASVVAAPAELTQARKDELKIAVGKISVSGMTNFSGGMLKGIDLGKTLDVAADMVVRVIMFTDGQPNQGIATADDKILALAKEHRGRVSISAFGYGTDCRQDLLASLATDNAGNYAFIANPEDAMAAFAKELGGLVSVHATDIEVTLKATGEHSLDDVISDVDTDDVDGGVRIKVPELLAEEKRHLVIAINLAAQKQAFPRATSVVDVEVAYSMVEGGKLVKKTDKTKAKLEFVKDGEQAKSPDKLLDKIVGMAQLVTAQVEAEAFAVAGNYAAAQSVVVNCADDFSARGLVDLNGLANNVSTSYTSADSYSSSAGYRNSSRSLLRRAYGASSVSADAKDDVVKVLFSAGMTVDNSAQSNTVQSFADTVAAQQPARQGNNLDPVAGSIDLQNKKPQDSSKAKLKGSKKTRSSRW